jgi:ATP-dependent Clp protease ATP-binding subunit ClpB
VQRRLTQLELAARQLDQETEEHAQERLAEIREEMAELRQKLASLREQWEAEKMGLGDVAEVQRRLDEAKVRYDQQMARIREQQATGRVDESAYQKLYELDNEVKKLQQHLEEAESKQAAGENADGKDKTTGRRLLRQEVGPDEIAEVVSAWTGVPVSRMLEKEKAKLLVLEERLHRRVVGQDEAVRAVSNAVRRSRSGLQDPNRPIGAFIFCGPTGVGKTELCKALAEVLFDDQNAMVRIDMSEYMEKHTVSRLIGAPPGYVGYEEGGALTEAIRRRPYAVLLLDEIEKAHRDVFNILLQVLDDGRLSDSHGHTVDFTNTIIVMTSNVGSQMIQELFDQGGSYEEMNTAVMEALQARFLPEFLNRVDEIIVFRPLAREEIRKIVDLQINRLARLLEQRGFGLEVSERARSEIAARGYDPAFGARPLKRVIQQELQNRLATELLKGEFPEGSTIRIDYDGSEFTFEALPDGNGAPRRGDKSRGDEIVSAEVV